VIRISLESTGSVISNNGGVIYIPYSWLARGDIVEVDVLNYLDTYITTTARAMPQKQDNLKIMLGNAVLASVIMDGKLFMGNVFDAVANSAGRKKIAPNKRVNAEAPGAKFPDKFLS
jgi:hypothetical protein